MFKSIIAIALFAASALAAIQFTNAPSAVEAGKSYTFTWSSTDSGPVTILVKSGPTNNLQTVGTVTSSGSGGTYTWTAPSTFAPGTYAFEINQGTNSNYWGPVQFTGGSGASSAGGSASAAPSASAASSVTSAAASASASSSGFSNRTTSSTTMSSSSRSLTSTSSAASATASKIASSNSATALGSPVALVLGALAAMLYLQ